ncbi:hypothetical protein AK812_SmicGene46804, partial [Symbiodinium microadriaticum]
VVSPNWSGYSGEHVHSVPKDYRITLHRLKDPDCFMEKAAFNLQH